MAEALSKTQHTGVRYTFEMQRPTTDGVCKYTLVVRKWLNEQLIDEQRFYDLTADNVRQPR